MLALALATQAAAEATKANEGPARRPAKEGQRVETLDERLDQKLAAARRYRAKVRFWRNHRRLLASAERARRGQSSLRYAERRLAELERTIARLRAEIRRRDVRRRASLRPHAAICDVFGSYCDQAVAVAWCESRLATTARNGQYLGLFQMGSYERRLYGHGAAAIDQAEAAHRYFVVSGRDWSPWSCRWAAY